ncbi:MAG: DegQ family serine endoprotease [Porticoccaceae bacterium]
MNFCQFNLSTDLVKNKRLRSAGVLGALLVAAALIMPALSVAAGLPDFTDLIEKNSPAVVKINTIDKVSSNLRRQELPPNMPDIFRDFFQQRPSPERKSQAIGSGFIISQDGYILTNNHVVDGADEIQVRLNDRQEFAAEVVGVDRRSDLALLKVDAEDLPSVKFAKSDDLRVGEWVVAIGSPFGLDYSASAGIVSAIGRSIPTERGEDYVPFIQTDVAINPGNSGGPLFNLKGEVVGINSQIYTRSGGSIGLSFAIPVSVALEVVDQLKDKGRVERGWLGVYIQDVDKDLAKSLGLSKPQGALIARVEENSPADKAGMKPGDVVIKLNGRSIVDASDLPHTVGLIKPGTTVAGTLIRNGQRREVSVKVDVRPGDEDSTSAQADQDRLGLEAVEIEERIKDNWRLPGGVMVRTVLPETPAERAGLQPGDVLVQLGYQVINNLSDYDQVLEKLPSNTPVALRFFRRGRSIFRTIELD